MYETTKRKSGNGYTPLTREVWEDKLGDWYVPEPNTGCWLWNRQGQDGCGYGMVTVDGHSRRAHRVAYQLLVGPIPDGLTIDHLCRCKPCVNPAHMEVVSSRTNTLRSNNMAARYARQTHCVRNHAFTPDNTYWTKQGGRECRACWNIRYAERRELIAAYRKDYLERNRDAVNAKRRASRALKAGALSPS